jgi:YD repeat-containing protein
MFKEMQYDEYDDHLNIVQLTPKGIGTSTVYLWGYNYTYPIAKIENATYDQVLGILREILKSSLEVAYEQLQTKKSEELDSIFQALRNHDGMKDSFIYSYTYEPLVGMISETTPNGIKTTYDYDAFGRLSDIRDHDSYILKHFEYNYATEPTR